MLQRSPKKPGKAARRRLQQRVRMARYRRRQAAGEVAVTVSFTQVETEKLRQYQFLGESELESRQAIAEALHALIARLVTRD